MLDFKNLKVGDEVVVVNNTDNNVDCYAFVNIGDVAKVLRFGDLTLSVYLNCKSWDTPLFFEPHQIETYVEQPKTSQSEDLIIYKSRWDEIIENLEGGNNGVAGMTDEEVEIVKSILKNNVPFNIVNDPVIVDPIIEKEEQTHLDATHIGDTGNCALYYKSELLKKWFWWSTVIDTWEECPFNYEGTKLIPITISK